MNSIATVDQLKAMRFSAMAKELENQMKDLESYRHLGFEERFGLLVDAEWNRRQENKLKKCINDANLWYPAANTAEIEYIPERKLDRAEIIRYSTCRYIEQGHHIILKGATGCGKTYIACALGNAACRKLKAVRYVRLPDLLDELTIARAEKIFSKVVKGYSKADLLILDDWLLQPLTAAQAYDLLEIVENRIKRGAVIFCTQYDEKEDWHSRINTDPENESPIADAIVDRIVNNSYVVRVEGPSMRERYGRAALERDGEMP
jgi:DNA replication protein DnaC